MVAIKHSTKGNTAYVRVKMTCSGSSEKKKPHYDDLNANRQDLHGETEWKDPMDKKKKKKSSKKKKSWLSKKKDKEYKPGMAAEIMNAMHPKGGRGKVMPDILKAGPGEAAPPPSAGPAAAPVVHNLTNMIRKKPK